MIHPRQILATLLLLALAITAQAQTAGQLAYDLYNGSIFEQKTLTPTEGQYLKWQNGLLVNATAAGGGTWSGTLGTTDNAIPRADGTGGSTLQGSLVTVNDAGDLSAPKVTLGDNGVGDGRIGLYDSDAGDYIYFAAGPARFIFPAVQANSFSGDGSSLTNLSASDISSGILGVANGGTGDTTHTANAVLLGNGTSPLLEVAPSTSGNVLTSNGTTWTSTAPANPAGTGSELQFRSSATAFGRVQSSSVSGAAITLGVANGFGVTSENYLVLRNTSAATSTLQQVSPSISFEGKGWKTDATAASLTVRFRQNMLPVLGTANPSATWRLQSEINNSGTWTDRVTMTTPGVFSVSGDSNTITLDAKDSNNTISSIRHINISPGNGWNLFLNAPVLVQSGSTFGFGSDVVLARDAANTLAQRNGTNAQTFRLYNTFISSTNRENATIGWAADVLSIGTEKGSGGGTARAMSLVTDGTVRMTFGTTGEVIQESKAAPSSATDTGTAGEVRYDANYIYRCTATNTWKRAALSTW
jgi:hypothetical protein